MQFVRPDLERLQFQRNRRAALDRRAVRPFHEVGLDQPGIFVLDHELPLCLFIRNRFRALEIFYGKRREIGQDHFAQAVRETLYAFDIYLQFLVVY